VTFPILLFAYLFSQFFRSFLTIIAGDLTRDLGYGPAELGWIGSAWFISFAIFQFPVGYMLDTIGPRRTVAGLMAVGVAGAIVFALAQGFPVSVLGMVLIGIGCSPMLMASLYIFGRTEPPERFAMLASAMIGFGNIGNLAAATPLALAVQTFGWRWSMAGTGIAMAVATALIMILLRDPPKALRSDGSRSSAIGDILAIIRMRPLWYSFPLHLISYGLVATERGLWVGPYLEQIQNMDLITRSNVIFAMSLGMAFGALACGPAARVFGTVKSAAIWGNAVTACLFLTLGLASGLGGWLAAVCLVLIGFFGLTYSLLLSHGRQFFPDHLLGRGVTFLNFLAIGGAGLLQAVTGQYIRHTQVAGVPGIDAYAHMHMAMGLVLLVVLTLFLKAPARPAAV
jgi:predicted MFS family arabinose efflux permease